MPSVQTPFNVRTTIKDGIVEEEDRSEKILASLKTNKIDAVISVVEGRSLSTTVKAKPQRNEICMHSKIN